MCEAYMVRHVMMWKVRSGAEDSGAILRIVKKELESLCGIVEGLESVRVSIFPYPSSSADAMVECVFDSPEALAAYKAHPAHLAVANKYIRPYMESRLSFDSEI